MKELTVTELEKIIILLSEELNKYYKDAFLYGSCLYCPNNANDVDILIVAEKIHHQQIHEILANFQQAFSIFIHITLICPSVFNGNPLFKEISMKGIRL